MDNYIGYLAKVFSQRSPLTTLSNSVLYRAVIMDTILKNSYNTQLFIYNPGEITDLTQPLVPGFIIEDKQFVPHARPMPRINGNWLHRLKHYLEQGVGYPAFDEWRKQNGIQIYADFDFARITYSKLKTFEVIKYFDPDLHPYTELLTKPLEQLDFFSKRYDMIFLKPDNGNQGKDIIVIKKENAQWAAQHYTHKKITTFEDVNIHALTEKLLPFINSRRYLIQSGIETARCGGCPFSIRVIMVDNGKEWCFFDHVLLGAQQADISYTPSSWDSVTTDNAFSKMFSPELSQKLQLEIKNISHELTAYLTKDFEGRVMELAYDFVISTKNTIHLVEINTKPGTWDKDDIKDIFHIQEREMFTYLHQLVPHVKACTEFLVSKLQQTS